MVMFVAGCVVLVSRSSI